MVTQFKEDFQSWLTSEDQDGFTMHYQRPQQTHKFQIWLQQQLYELGIQSAEFRLVNGELLIENVIYDEMGKPSKSYEINYILEDVNNPDNIKEIRVVL